MTETPTHTPLPWTAERDLPHNRMPRVHSSADGSLICECGNMGTTQKQWEANAAFIVQAVNSHHRLVEAAQAMLPSNLNLADWLDDSAVIPMDVTVGELRRLLAALKEAGRG